ncbi:formyltetrahydrofolate deformylase [Paraflavitalea soli]|uniref:Formyltetrahydrofolate deformylase n=1 Tax=Paraflavitalea soli TaxID=2315862 RepID=A0A3B7MRH7_9BACT|nr:formyltetrahydrofolate deformylase [Paraflavitalea soli]AXY74215.1 formyltetrahydrofolate deformylase [Paraflavitalea soli]
MIILIQCNDKVGLVAAISGVLARQQLNIVSLREHVDKAENRFFLRVEVEQPADPLRIEEQLRQVLPSDAVIIVNPLPEKKVVVMVTKEYHCLADMLVRHYFKTLQASIQAVIGNYNTLEDVCHRFDIPFHHISHEAIAKEAFEQQISTLIQQYAPDYIVLAKFMRILSPAFVAAFPGRIINIHHSFLPAFAGANPYRQAFERGVKLIGATAHFVTNDLDEGPIIAQQIIPVSHSLTASDMMRAGKEIETAVLAKALRLVFDDRVFVYNNKTVVFE